MVLKESDLPVGAEVNVYYNPDNPEEKYIEGFEESPFSYFVLGLLGAALGTTAIYVAHMLKKKPDMNNIIDIVDKPV